MLRYYKVNLTSTKCKTFRAITFEFFLVFRWRNLSQCYALKSMMSTCSLKSSAVSKIMPRSVTKSARVKIM